MASRASVSRTHIVFGTSMPDGSTPMNTFGLRDVETAVELVNGGENVLPTVSISQENY